MTAVDIVSTLVAVALTAAVVIPLIVVVVLVRQLVAIARSARDGDAAEHDAARGGGRSGDHEPDDEGSDRDTD